LVDLAPDARARVWAVHLPERLAAAAEAALCKRVAVRSAAQSCADAAAAARLAGQAAGQQAAELQLASAAVVVKLEAARPNLAPESR
jgi:hypothetical protein